jgi:hypothetical protein
MAQIVGDGKELSMKAIDGDSGYLGRRQFRWRTIGNLVRHRVLKTSDGTDGSVAGVHVAVGQWGARPIPISVAKCPREMRD